MVEWKATHSFFGGWIPQIILCLKSVYSPKIPFDPPNSLVHPGGRMFRITLRKQQCQLLSRQHVLVRIFHGWIITPPLSLGHCYNIFVMVCVCVHIITLSHMTPSVHEPPYTSSINLHCSECCLSADLLSCLRSTMLFTFGSPLSLSAQACQLGLGNLCLASVNRVP